MPQHRTSTLSYPLLAAATISRIDTDTTTHIYLLAMVLHLTQPPVTEADQLL
jgi:hypothetical protein